MALVLNVIAAMLTGAVLLGVGVWAGSWLRAAATDPAMMQVRATNRELMAFRKRALSAMGYAISEQASIINDPSTSLPTRRRLEEVQKCLAKTTESSRDERRRS